MSAQAPACDVLIVGAGPVGAALGCLLLVDRSAAAGRVCIVDGRLPDLDQALHDLPLDLRVFALSRASERILAAAGAWDAIAGAGPGPYERMCVWSGEDDPRGSASLRFDAAEQGQPNLGHIVPNNVLQGALLRRFVALGGRLIEDSIQGLEFAASQVQVRGARSLHDAQLVVGADGAQSAVRQLAGIAVEQGRYGQTALVANLRPAQSHEGTAWQRFLDHGTLALLPLASGEVSIVWSLPEATAQQRSQLSPAEFAAAVTQDSAAVLGDLALTTPVARFPLRRVAAAQYVRDRIVLAGDAAHVVHPLAGQGVNLGLLDAASLADTLREARQQGEDPGASRVLRNYERWRKSENGLMALAMDGFNRFLAESGDRWSQLARRGMRAVGDNAALRGWFADRALGMSGDLPRAARRPGPRE